MGKTMEQKINDLKTRHPESEFRKFNFEIRAAETTDDKELIVEGYAATFNQEATLFEYDGVEYKEVIKPGAFDDADMSDVIFNYNHGGKVMARIKNKTLELRVDDKGLFIKAKLDGTVEGRDMYEEIRGGYIDKMSFQFTVKEDSYDRETHTRKIHAFKRIYDVSAVDIPAYESTGIGARYFNKQHQEEFEEMRKRKLKLELDIILGGDKW